MKLLNCDTWGAGSWTARYYFTLSCIDMQASKVLTISDDVNVRSYDVCWAAKSEIVHEAGYKLRLQLH